ncbi:MAG: calcium-binding protein [Gomphosphaeria aponina SAG 52.96 = DSM 107014]|uniref:Calcium-binding protein n=1 Tax=Gomphosphaeria aponina SAG 52.96 = DSM 107014 TaxID=1521640 RepID=A0A941JRW5_9CHRO|nr:calcium-binding protein [Gomphosphaeria aponina SAG 52.96 = DSM 107014]
MAGGAGDDTYIVTETADVVVETADSGTDTINTNITQTLGNNVENLVQTGSDNINGTGNTLNNSLTGNSGNNILDGKTGNDSMAGGAGNDTYIVGQTADVVEEATDSGTDTVNTNIAQTLANNVENLVQTGTANINGTGNALDNSLTGNSGSNSLNGAAGNDNLLGGNGNDQLTGSGGNDILTGGAGADWFIFNATTDMLDTITDFNGTQKDQLRISAGGFGGGLVPGATLPSSQFVLGAAALDTSDRFIYNTGALFYDVDGLGGTAQVQIATFTGAPTLAAGNIFIF